MESKSKYESVPPVDMGEKDTQVVDTTNPTVTKKEKKEIPPREHWGGQFDFLLAMIGYAVGFGNIWRFPYLCYKNGGGAFLIPYFICVVTAGVPMALLETQLGQFMGQGGILCWKICPMFQGIGYATTFITWWCNNYYIVILAYAIYYFYSSFTTSLPWMDCENDWNTNACIDETRKNFSCSAGNFDLNGTCYNVEDGVSSAEEFWKLNVLRISSGLGELGSMNMHLLISVIVAWILVYFCIWKGVRSSGKVVYFTATFPYVVLTILLIRGVTLPGAGEGIKFYLTPDFSRLLDSQVWIDGGTQIFYSYAIGFAALIALGSYNKFHHDCYRDTMILAFMNSFTSIYGGFAIFSVLGFMAHQQGVNVTDVADKGPGLVFIAYPTAVSMMPGAPIWSCIFFFMLILVGLDSQFVQVESFVTAVGDIFPRYVRGGYRREVFSLIVCMVSAIPAMFMICEGGQYIFQLYDYYSVSGVVLLIMAFSESFAIAWVYGANRYYENMVEMIGYRPFPWFKYAWLITVPLISVAIWLFAVVQWQPLKYNDYVYPLWGEAIGWALALSSILCIPGNMIVRMIMTPGSIAERWRILTTPDLSHLGKNPDSMPMHIYTPA